MFSWRISGTGNVFARSRIGIRILEEKQHIVFAILATGLALEPS